MKQIRTEKPCGINIIHVRVPSQAASFCWATIRFFAREILKEMSKFYNRRNLEKEKNLFVPLASANICRSIFLCSGLTVFLIPSAVLTNLFARVAEVAGRGLL